MDTKVRFKLDAHFRQKALSEFDVDWQLLHYAWEVGEVLGEPVKVVGPHLITLTPKVSGVYHPVMVNPFTLSEWHRQAEKLWLDMYRVAEGYDLPTANLFSCTTKFGRCEFWDACHVLDRDEEKMGTVYQRKRLQEYKGGSSAIQRAD